MKKQLLSLIVLASSLCTFAQWTAFPGSGATSISCGSADQLVCTAVGNIYRFNFNTNQWGLLATAPGGRGYNQASVAADGTVWGVFSSAVSNSNLRKSAETPALLDRFTDITGVLSNISVSNRNYAIGSIGADNNNIYYANALNSFSLLSSNLSSYMTVVGNDGSIWTITNSQLNVDNVYKYIGGAWIAVPGIRASYIAVGDANKVLIVSGGEIYYLSSTQQWVKDLNSPTGITKVTISSSGHAYAMTSVGGANNVLKSTWSQIAVVEDCNNFTAPVVTTSIQNLTICEGANIELSASGTGTIAWYSEEVNGDLLGEGSSIILSDNIASKTVYAQRSSGECMSDRVAATITVIPSPVADPNNNTVVCQGEEKTLTVTGSGTLSWYDHPSNGNLIHVGESFTTVAQQPTNYFVELTNGSCSHSRLQVDFNVQGRGHIWLETPNENLSICAGDNTVLVAFTFSGSVMWYDLEEGGTLLHEEEVNLSTSNFITPYLFSNTTFYVQAQFGSSCPSDRVAIDIVVNNVPTEVSILPEGNILNVNGVFSAYEWFNVANPTEVLATTESFEVLENGVYKVKVTNQEGCSAESEPLTVEVLNMTNTNSLKGIELYPNPASDFINFEKPAGYDVRFYDVVGNEINQIKTLEGKATINVENLPEGIYFLRMTNQYEALVEKIVIKR